MSAIDLATTAADPIVEETKAAAAKLKDARAAVAEVIFGQETVVERALTTVLSGGHGLLVGVPGLAKTKLVDTMGTVLGLTANRIQFTPDLMPSDILGSEILDESRRPQAQLPLRAGPGLRAAADGGRDQPRQPAHAVGAAAIDAGALRDDRGPALRPAAAIPCARDAEPDRAGGHLSPPRGAARPLPDADRRALSRPRRRAAHAVRDDGR